MKGQFLSRAAIADLWIHKLQQSCPRLRSQFPNTQGLFKGKLKEDLGLDSLELMEIASHFHGMFHLMEGDLSLYLLQYEQITDWIDAIWRGANDWDKPVSFFSSGSQGKPKSCSHNKESLLIEVESWYKIFNPKASLWRWVPPHHIYGFLFGVLLPDQKNLLLRDARAEGLQRFIEEQHAEDWVIGFPEIYNFWLKSGLKLCPGMRMISSTAPLAVEIAQAFYESGLKPLEIYGSSETAGIAYRTFPDKYYKLLPYWKRNGSTILKQLPEKERLIESVLQDHIIWRGKDEFSLEGRKDKAVQIGGINVYPDLIARRMEEINGIVKVWVRMMEPPEGKRLSCWVKTSLDQKDWKQLEKQCYHWVEKNLKTEERPRNIRISQLEPPTNSIGKLMEWEILPTLNS